MKGSQLISSIKKGQWAIDFNNIGIYTPMIDKIVKGKKFEFNSNHFDGNKSALSYVDQNGRKIISKDAAKDLPEGSIAVVNMRGEVIKYGDWCVWGADEITQQLYEADRNPNVIGTILNIDGPGGAVSAIGTFLQFAKNKTKPVIGLADDALSLHYWTAVAVCDRIIADNNISARFGSVGVMLSFMDGIKALKEKGYEYHEVYSDLSEHKNEAYRLAREGKYELIKKEHLNPLAIKFQENVKHFMPNIKHQEVGVITGKTFYADDALELNMIHGIGDVQMAIDQIQILSAINNINN